MEKLLCHDCGREIEVKNEKIISAKIFVYKTKEGKKIEILKCKDCYEKITALRNYQDCEVYSRVVGYLRPVQQWNKGKQKEFHDRKEFDLSTGEGLTSD